MGTLLVFTRASGMGETWTMRFLPGSKLFDDVGDRGDRPRPSNAPRITSEIDAMKKHTQTPPFVPE